MSRISCALAILMPLLLVTACGGSSTPPPPPPPLPTLSGSMTGLTDGSVLFLANNGGDKLAVSKNGTFTFSNAIALNSAYAVTISAHPAKQRCSITNGTGANVQADVVNVAVACSDAKETVLHHFEYAQTEGRSPSSELTLGADGNFYGVTAEGGASHVGTVFKVTPAGVHTLLHSFAGGATDGATPIAGLTAGADGNFYGVTVSGGTSNKGTFFRVAPNGVHTLLHSFGGGATEGAWPLGTLTLTRDGNFYGTTLHGGTADAGTVYMMTPSGVATLLHSFAGTPMDGGYPSGSLTQGSDGNFYTVTQGGAAALGAVVKITPLGTTTILYSFGNDGTDGMSPTGSLVIGPDGDFYGMTSGGGRAYNGTFFKINKAGVKTTLHSFGESQPDGSEPRGRLLVGGDGNFYGSTGGGGPNHNGIIFMMTPAGAETILHSFDPYGGDGAEPPAGLTFGADGYLYGVTRVGGMSGSGVVFRY